MDTNMEPKIEQDEDFNISSGILEESPDEIIFKSDFISILFNSLKKSLDCFEAFLRGSHERNTKQLQNKNISEDIQVILLNEMEEISKEQLQRFDCLRREQTLILHKRENLFQKLDHQFMEIRFFMQETYQIMSAKRFQNEEIDSIKNSCLYDTDTMNTGNCGDINSPRITQIREDIKKLTEILKQPINLNRDIYEQSEMPLLEETKIENKIKNENLLCNQQIIKCDKVTHLQQVLVDLVKKLKLLKEKLARENLSEQSMLISTEEKNSKKSKELEDKIETLKEEIEKNNMDKLNWQKEKDILEKNYKEISFLFDEYKQESQIKHLDQTKLLEQTKDIHIALELKNRELEDILNNTKLALKEVENDRQENSILNTKYQEELNYVKSQSIIQERALQSELKKSRDAYQLLKNQLDEKNEGQIFKIEEKQNKLNKERDNQRNIERKNNALLKGDKTNSKWRFTPMKVGLIIGGLSVTWITVGYVCGLTPTLPKS